MKITKHVVASRFAGVLLGSVAFGMATTASAQTRREGEYPVNFVERPLTLPAKVLSPFVELEVTHEAGDFPGAGETPQIRRQAGFGAVLGGYVGVTDDFQLEATIAPFSLAPDVRFSGFVLGETYRLTKGTAEVGLHAAVTIPVGPTGFGAGEVSGGKVALESGRFYDMQFNFGLPVLLHADKIRIDTGLHFGILTNSVYQVFDTSASHATRAGLIGPSVNPLVQTPGFPLKFAFQVVDRLHVAVNTGFGIHDFGAPGKTYFMPLGAGVGYAVPIDSKPFSLLDLGATFTFPELLSGIAHEAGGNVPSPGDFVLNLGAELHIDL